MRQAEFEEIEHVAKLIKNLDSDADRNLVLILFTEWSTAYGYIEGMKAALALQGERLQVKSENTKNGDFTSASIEKAFE